MSACRRRFGLPSTSSARDPRALELIDADFQPLYVEINRNDKYVRLGPKPTRDDKTDLTSWYFPRDWLPPLATLLDLVTRAVALAWCWCWWSGARPG